MYADHILDHYHAPRHTGTVKNPTHSEQGHNTSCGDTVDITFSIRDGIIQDAGFSGEGCAISQAATSLLLEHVTGKPIDILANMTASDMLELLEMPLSAGRIKCGLLALETAHRAIKK